jgi:hypothetical protein
MATQHAVLTWPQLLAALKTSTSDRVLIRDGRTTLPADAVRTKPAAAGTEFCLFAGGEGSTRASLITQLETLAKGPGRRFTSSAKASVGGAGLLVDAVADEDVDGKSYVVVVTRRAKLGYNQSQSSAAPPELGRSSKRIKTG